MQGLRRWASAVGTTSTFQLRLGSGVRDQPYKAAQFSQTEARLAVLQTDQLQLLRVTPTDGNNHSSAFSQLFEQRAWHFGTSRGNDDGIVRRLFPKALTAIAHNHAYVVVAHR